jgi:hypothetical protein
LHSPTVKSDHMNRIGGQILWSGSWPHYGEVVPIRGSLPGQDSVDGSRAGTRVHTTSQ